jgi:hypothetical protein
VERVEERVTSLVGRVEAQVEQIARQLDSSASVSTPSVSRPIEDTILDDILPGAARVESLPVETLTRQVNAQLATLLGPGYVLSPEHIHIATTIAGAIAGVIVWSVGAALLRS